MREKHEQSSRDSMWAILTGLGLIAFGLLWELRWQRLLRTLSTRDQNTEQWVERALHDPLTSLPNRTLLQDRIEQALVRAQRNETSIAILFIDLDDFKTINDEFGHLVGDQLLIAAGERFRQYLRASDTAARLGGDEFVVVLETSRDHEAALMVADRLRSALEVPLLLEPERLTLNASIGVAIAQSADDTPKNLLQEADRALLEAKRLGKNQVVLAPINRASVISGERRR